MGRFTSVPDAALSGELQHKAYVSAADVDKYKHRLETVDQHYVEGSALMIGNGSPQAQ